jgi:hypothetical protein
MPWYGYTVRSRGITRQDQQYLFQSLSCAEKLDALEQESAQLCEINPGYCFDRFIHSFKRKQENDAKRAS